MQDPIELLLPDADEAQREVARRVTMLARLVVDDARPKLAQSERLDLASAREELEREQAIRLARALDALIAAYLAFEAARLESFFWFEANAIHHAAKGEAGLVQEAWSVLLEARVEAPKLPGVPHPGEAPLEVARGLCDALGELRAGASVAAVHATWRAVIHGLENGPAAGESALREVLKDHAAAEPRDPTIESRLVAHVTECLLERGAVREALHWLQERRSLFCESARLGQLHSWCSSLVGVVSPEGAREAETGGGFENHIAPLPARLAQLREGTEAWSAGLHGVASPHSRVLTHAGSASLVRESGAAPSPRQSSQMPGRSDLGLSCLAVFQLSPNGTAVALHVDAAPALKERVPKWLKQRSDACAVPTDPQHVLFVRAAETICHRATDVTRAALGGAGALALALTPILDPTGEVAGWIHGECEHHLLPAGTSRSRLVEGWREEVLRARVAAEDSGEGLARDSSASSTENASMHGAKGAIQFEWALRPRSAQVFERIVNEWASSLTHRCVRGFSVQGSKLLCVYESGMALSGREAERGVGGETGGEQGGGRALGRALQSGGTVLFADPDPRLSLHPRAGSGFAVPIRLDTRSIGLLSIESSRRRDLGEREAASVLSIANRCGVSLLCAQFADAHANRHGFVPCLDAERADFGEFFERASRAARSQGALVLAGPRGSGKRVLARLLASLGECSEPEEWTPGDLDLEGKGDRFVERLVTLCGEVLVLDGIEDLTPQEQGRLLRAIEQAGPSAPRLWTRLRRPLSELVSAGRLREELALRLGRLELIIPPLCERREEVPTLAKSLVASLAEAENREAPDLDEEVLALLWRQPWQGNARELEATLARALHEADDILLPAHFEASALQARLLPRIASKSPARSDLISALWTTRKQNGRGNRRRAALYLGWDPETLARRCSEAEVSIDSPEAPTPWHKPRV